ncbi:hypothetical protein ACGYKB_18585 [Sulfitobacter sp. 916]|uniref:hypothetical protein n=1 Tax=Sulfitobacter sp. 916 TaxID=3368559 RepID=UPI003745556C
MRQNLEFLRHKFYNPLIFSEFLCDRTPGVIRDTLDPGDELDFPFLRDLLVRWRPALRQKVDGARWQKGQKFRKGAELVKALERPSMRVFPIAAEIPVNLLRALTSYPAVASRKTGQRAQSFSSNWSFIGCQSDVPTRPFTRGSMAASNTVQSSFIARRRPYQSRLSTLIAC